MVGFLEEGSAVRTASAYREQHNTQKCGHRVGFKPAVPVFGEDLGLRPLATRLMLLALMSVITIIFLLIISIKVSIFLG
jgi:hypothetical protein